MIRNVYKIEKAGAIDNLKLVEEEIQEPTGDQVLVRIKSIGLNFADIFALKGLYSATPKGSFIPGLEYSGEVLQCGESVSKFKPGDRVMGVTRFGAYVSHLVNHENYLTPMPESWTYPEGASYLVQVLTAYYGLRYLGNIHDQSTVLIHSAAGGVGIWANRIAKTYNAFTIGTIGNSSKIEFCKNEGYDQVIVRSSKFKSQLNQALGDKPLNLVMDSIGGEIFKTSYVKLASEGRIVVYGSARYTTQGSRPDFLKLFLTYFRRPKIDPQSMINYNKSIMGFNLIYLYQKVDLMQQMVAEIMQLDLGKPFVGNQFSFERLKDAVYLFQTGQTIGKIVVNV